MSTRSITFALLGAALSVITASTALAADAGPMVPAGSSTAGMHRLPPFPVLKSRILHRMHHRQEMLQRRESCVSGAENFAALHECFPRRH
uniref:Uncharacterized protein n=1 Tax=mine drainage metagenome TaxID=410659 RepID=E6QLY0_9ZZZZ